MDSRLDRLFSLLDSGTTAVTRKAAAQQIGEIQKYHPYTLYNLLERARIFLHNKNWDTRVAAGEAIECIANNVPLWRPSTDASTMKEAAEKKEEGEEQSLFNFADFDIEKVMKRGAVLVASGGQEFDDDEAVDDKTRLANQRKQLKQKLGFTAQFSEDGLVEDDDLITMKSQEEIARQRREEDDAKRKAEEMQAEMQLKGLSARQRIQAKRKLRQSGKGEPDPSRKKQKTEDTSDKKKLKTVVTAQPSTSDKVVVESVVDTERTFDDESEWPLERFCAELFVDLFDTRWEVRHGAAIGLRSVLKRHINSAGRRAETNLEEQMREHLKWREDATIRCLCVLALDRFNDFLTDRAVAPVRETVAQVLAMLLRHVEKQEKTEIKYETKVKQEESSENMWTDKQVYLPVVELVQKTLKSLYVLTNRATWEERLSGFLGIKYLMATRHDLVHELLPLALPAVVQGVRDKEDDVRMVAAEALVPLISTISDRSSDAEISALLAILWNTLLDLDDLTASTSSVMTLLAEFYSMPRVAAMQPSQLGTLDQLVPRLWPFFRHNVQSVRKCALQTLDKLLSLNQEAWTTWVPRLLSETLQILYQNVLLEPSEDLVTDSQHVWQKILERIDPQLGVSATQAQLGTWFKLLCTPRGVPFDRSAMLIVEHPSHKQHSTGANQTNQPSEQAGVIDNIEASTAIRVAAARTMAHLMKLYCATEHAPVYTAVVLEQLKANSASKRLSVSILIAEWTQLVTETARDQFPVPVRDQLLDLLAVRNDSTLYYDEVMGLLTHLSNDCRVLVKSFQNIGVPVQSPIDLAPTSLISVELAASLATAWYEQQIALVADQSAAVKGQPTVRDKLEARRKRLLTTMGHLESVQTELHISVLASLAAAVIALAQLPPKLNAIINPLMKSIKTEQEAPLQQRSGRALAQLMLQSSRREPNPNTMITQNVIKALCTEGHHKLAALTRAAAPAVSVESEEGDEKKKRGRKKESSEVKPDEDSAAVKEARLSVRGAQYTLQALAEVFRSTLFQSLTRLWEQISVPFKSALMSAQISPELDQQLIDALHVISTVIAHADKTLWSEITELMKMMIQLIPKLSTETRELNAVALAHICHVLGVAAMKIVLDQLVPLLQHQTNIEARLGAAVALHHIIDRLGFDIVPYVIFLIIPIMGRMSDQSIQVRKTVTFSFATLIRLMPLERGIPDPQGFSEELIKQKQKERHFLEQLLDGNKLDNYDLPIKINGELRQYQQEGVNWMAFLNKYNLHGILCDDMGLGKTLQAICILASDDIERRRRYRETPGPECIPLPSLVICPPTLIGHWEDEVLRFCGPGTKTLQYLGPPAERARLRSIFSEHQFIIMSYDIVRNDIENLEKLQFNYAVLDEGHIIKNAKTKITQAVKRIRAHHRLILSGTPIQNNVLELWSLFDFLMPGFLGDEKQFNDLYSKPILASRDAKASSKEQEAGELALEALHRQVLPFVLRRVKEDVLHDLPPKIIQDYHCELSPLQARLYEDFAKTGMKREVEGEIKSDAESGQAEKSNHIFQALQYLRKLCSHPCLVLDENHPEYTQLTHELQQSSSHLHDIQHAPKLLALKELLHECGIGVTSKATDKTELVESVVCQHRVLIFCQMKTMLDIIEQDLFKTHMPTVTYMRLDGTVPTNQRTQLVSRFNNDISIDCMLLTTAVGGLGLNLQTADTVIFVEHDWNPMKDLQAMDRAHRIGQKKTVNVYRLITRGTLEEKIMSLQKFKLNIANSVVNKDNQSFQSMDTSQLLDLFNYNNAVPHSHNPNTHARHDESDASVAATGPNKGIGALLNSLGELWDESQYEEYDLNAFIKSLK